MPTRLMFQQQELNCARSLAVNALWAGRTLDEADRILRAARFDVKYRRAALEHALAKLKTVSPGAAVKISSAASGAAPGDVSHDTASPGKALSIT